jgi:hypothetical protein
MSHLLIAGFNYPSGGRDNSNYINVDNISAGFLSETIPKQDLRLGVVITVISGCASWRRPGSHTPDLGY